MARRIRLLFIFLATCLLLGTASLAAEKKTITVCVSMEKFTLGQGYIIEPTLIEVPAEAEASLVITTLLEERWPEKPRPWQQTGELTSAFYLSAAYDPDREAPQIPTYISRRAKISLEDATPQWLGEFDYCGTSGWMYSVKDKFPNVGAAEYLMEQGDVMRWQFTLYGYGADLGADNSEWGAEDITSVGNKDALTWEVALLNRAYSKTLREQNPAYQKALAVLQDLEAGQEKIDSALAELRTTGPRFADVSEPAWYRIPVEQAVKMGLFRGTSDTLFAPEHSMSRAMAATVLYRMTGSPSSVGQSFSDVKSSDWYSAAASWAYTGGLMQDFTNKQMLPNQMIKRMELAAMLYRQLDGDSPAEQELLSDFSDSETIPEGFRPAMSWAVEQGIFQGSDRRLMADAELTRSQFAAIAVRLAELMVCD